MKATKVGHAGTLDPPATGLLVIGLGKATRLFRYLSGLDKVYSGEIVFGYSTHSQDNTGTPLKFCDMSFLTIDEVRDQAKKLTGEIKQLPPMVSAKKIGGKRLYELARESIEVERKPCAIFIELFEVEDLLIEERIVVGEQELQVQTLKFSIKCSSGTYVRTIAHDLGILCGGFAHLRNLRRLKVGHFDVVNSLKVNDITQDSLLGVEEGISTLEHLRIDENTRSKVLNGYKFPRGTLGATGDPPWAIVDSKGKLIGIYSLRDDYEVPEIVLR